MERVIIQNRVLRKLDQLIPVLHNKKYFGTKTNAHAYVDGIVDFIESIPQQRQRLTINTKYGAWYCEYKPNRRTSWFITFDKNEDVYLVKNLMNNHTKEYPAYIRGL